MVWFLESELVPSFTSSVSPDNLHNIWLHFPYFKMNILHFSQDYLSYKRVSVGVNMYLSFYISVTLNLTGWHLITNNHQNRWEVCCIEGSRLPIIKSGFKCFLLREIETIIIFLSSPTLHHSFSMACNSLIEILEKKLASIILDYKIRESIIENLAWTN